ncbi:MAG TPA: DUF6122 family protein [Desulfurivibrionaceae bacterium]|nr:DUF6122 family protein [Desulfurivibrionaceae bacterium]
MLLQTMHVFLPFAASGQVAWLFFRSRWWWAWLLMLSAMLIDLDHLLAVPVYDPGRCSLGFHPLQCQVATTGYLTLKILPAGRFLVGLLLHLGLDGSDCLLMGGMP